MRRFEVPTLGTERAVVPRDRCCACGRQGGPGVYWSGDTLHVPFMKARLTSPPEYDFPLCHDCGRAKAARNRFLYAGALLAGAAGLVASVLWWIEDPPAARFERVVHTILLCGLAASAGLGVGWVAAMLAGLVHPYVRRGNEVADSAYYRLESWSPGRRLDEYRVFFRFSNEEYARDFAQANGAFPDPPLR